MRCFLLLTVLFLSSSTYAQRSRVPLRPVQDDISAADSARIARYNLAQSFLNAAQFDRAIALLEDLYVDHPGNHQYFRTLKEAYEAVKRYEDAITLTDAALQRFVPTGQHELMADKARLLFLNGDEPEALATWDAVLDDAPRHERLYRLVYESMLQVRLIDRAIVVLQRGRTALERHELFQTELAYLYSLAGSHEKALNEYLALLVSNPRQISYVRGRLSQSLQQAGAMETSLPLLRDHVENAPFRRSFRELYAWMLVENGDFEPALAQYQILSREEEQPGQFMFDFARRAADMDAYEVAATAYGAVLQHDTPFGVQAQLGLAEMHRKHGDQLASSTDAPTAHQYYEEAMTAYRTFLRLFPADPQYPEVLRRIGELQQTAFDSDSEAKATLQEVIRTFPGTAAARQARFDLGRMAIKHNELDVAIQIFEMLESQLGAGTLLAEQSRHERALIRFYQGDFPAARALVGTLRQNAMSDVANDAIGLRLVLLENPGPDSANAALQQYAATALLLRQHQLQEAIASADQILGYWGQHPIADDTRYLRAQTLRRSGNIDDALVAFGEMALAHPDSPLADRALFEYADILHREMKRPAEAIVAYSDLLMRYPGSLLAVKARERLRDLRVQGV